VNYILFILITLSLCSGFFSLGGVVFLYKKYHTFVLRIAGLFILSLVLLSAGQWADVLRKLSGDATQDNIKIIVILLSLSGLIINVSSVPYLVSALIAVPIQGLLKKILLFWDAILVISGVLYPFLPNPSISLIIINVQLILTIFSSVISLLLNIKHVVRKDLQASLVAFLWISAVFFVLLVLDIFISGFLIQSLAFLDGLSLPLYIIALNMGSFFFIDRFMNDDPLLVAGRLTETCKTNYGITDREAEIIEKLLEGLTNQELADALFISKKTVENHIYNIFQKMGVKNRVQLIGTLRLWKEDTREKVANI
jgi:DNA-binding CsgD family transcriptional regulator